MWIIKWVKRINKGKQGERGLGIGEEKERDHKEEYYLEDDKLKEDERGAGKVERVYIILQQHTYGETKYYNHQGGGPHGAFSCLLWLMYLSRSAKPTSKTLLTCPANHLP